jgi:hypothetical protein
VVSLDEFFYFVGDYVDKLEWLNNGCVDFFGYAGYGGGNFSGVSKNAN